MKVKPASGRTIPDPEKGGALPLEGRDVERNAYWLRRISEGDVVEVSAVKPTKPKGADK